MACTIFGTDSWNVPGRSRRSTPFDSWGVAVSSCLYALESFSTKRAPTSKGFQYLRSGSGTHHSRWSVSPVRYQRTPRKRVFQAVTILREKRNV